MLQGSTVSKVECGANEFIKVSFVFLRCCLGRIRFMVFACISKNTSIFLCKYLNLLCFMPIALRASFFWLLRIIGSYFIEFVKEVLSLSSIIHALPYVSYS